MWVTREGQVMGRLKRSLDAAETADLQPTPAKFEKHVTIANRDAPLK